MKNYVMKKAQSSSDENLKKIAKILKSYNKLAVEDKKKISVATEKLYTKLKAQETKAPAPKKSSSAPKTSGSKKKIATQDLKSVIAKFKQKVGAKVWKQATSGTTSVKQDAERPALPKGKRFSKITGKAYWENRANRSDVKQPPKTYPRLAKGGAVGTFPFLKFEDGQEAIKKANNGELPKYFSYVEKEKMLYYLPSLYGKWIKLKSFETKKDSIEWVKSNLKQEGFAKGGQTGEKVYDEMMNVGKSKYVVNFHDGEKKHKDGSPFFDIAIFKNKVEKENFVKDLKSKGYSKRKYADGDITDMGGLQFIEYKGEEIMYEPTYKEYFFNERKYMSLESAKKAVEKAVSGGGADQSHLRGAYSRGLFAKGGIIEHGLKKGDKVVDSFYNVVVVENDGEKFVVNLNVGKRYTEEKYFSMNFGNMSKAMKE
jgi:hypothetical protein